MKQIVLITQILALSILAIGCMEYQSQDHQTKIDNRPRNNNSLVSPTPATGLENQTSESPPLKSAQSRFGAERDLARKSPIPAAIWKWIIDNEENIDLRAHVLENNNADSWVYGSEIDLNNDTHADYVIMAHQPPLAGANITTFWVFLNEDGEFRCVLRTSALELDISRKIVNGLRKISSFSASATASFETDFVFDGTTYKAASRKSKVVK